MGIPVVYVFVCALELSVPREFLEGILLAVTPTKHCVGIKIFDDSCELDQNGNLDNDFEAFIDRCIYDAVELKKAIEVGAPDIENDPRIVKNPNSDSFDIEMYLEQRAKSKYSFDCCDFICVGISLFFTIVLYILQSKRNRC